jgi:hypothetical protein
MSIQPATIDMIKIIATALGDLNDRAVFVGGAAVPFYLPDAYLSQARPTEDIDVVMEVVGRKAGWLNDEALRTKGFQHDTSEGAPICRWLYHGFKVDVMSVDASTVGFTNIWYKEGVERAIEVITAPVSVKIFSLSYFLASKIVAFRDRGKNDYMGSRDIEDIVSLLEVASEELLEKQLPQASQDVHEFLKKEFQLLLATSDFIDCIPGAVFNRASANEASALVVKRITSLTKIL